MKTLSKIHREYLLELIKENSLTRILYYCKGAGFDINSYSSPVHYESGKLTIRYRGNNSYYYICITK